MECVGHDTGSIHGHCNWQGFQTGFVARSFLFPVLLHVDGPPAEVPLTTHCLDPIRIDSISQGPHV
jgi:hypothetical protein